jgi:excisionase family DNA binding protein
MRRKLLRISEIAKLLDCRNERVARLIREGILPAVRLGRQIRIDPHSLERFIETGGQALPGDWRREAK